MTITDLFAAVGILAIILGAVSALLWWIEVGSARAHMRQAIREVNGQLWREHWPRHVPFPPPLLARQWDANERASRRALMEPKP